MARKKLTQQFIDAVYAEEWERVRTLALRGADVRAKDSVGLRYAVEKGEVEVVELMIERGADVHVRDNFAIKMAAARGCEDTIKHLLQAGADVSAQNFWPLRAAFENGHPYAAKLMDSWHAEKVKREERREAALVRLNAIREIRFRKNAIGRVRERAQRIPKLGR